MGAIKAIVFLIPLILILVLLEYYISKRKNFKVYFFKDSIVNISCGVMERLSDLFFVIFSFYAFNYVHEYAIFSIPDTILTFLPALLAADFLAYWHHRKAHEINLLWASHIVHHQSEEMNLTTVFRVSGFAVFTRFAFFIWMPIIGFSVSQSLAAIVFIGVYQFVTHTRLVGKLGFLEYIFVTPSSHRVHHGRNDQYLDMNYGHVFIIWDRMFGTFAEEEEEVEFGIVSRFKSQKPFWAYFYYFVDLYKRGKQANRWIDRFLIFFKPPDWTPEGVEPFDASKLSHDPYRPATPARLRNYIIGTMVVTFSAFFLVMAFAKKSFTPIETAILISIVLLSIYSLGFLLEHRKFAIKTEFFRIGMILLTAPYLLVRLEFWPYSYGFVLVLCLGLGFWLYRIKNELKRSLKDEKLMEVEASKT